MISFIIPTLNEEKILEKTLKGLSALSSIPYEIIISDGKSKDKTIEISRCFTNKVIVYEGTERQTIGGGRNLGAKYADGDFLVFIDADVQIPNIDTFFKKTLEIFDAEKDLVALSVFMKVLPEYATFSDNIFFGLMNWNYYFSNKFGKGMAGGDFQMVRTSAFKQLGGFNEKLAAGEDVDMFNRLSKIGKTKIIPSLYILHTSRRAHSTGWMKLLFSWSMNWFYATFLKRSWSSEWKEIR